MKPFSLHCWQFFHQADVNTFDVFANWFIFHARVCVSLQQILI